MWDLSGLFVAFSYSVPGTPFIKAKCQADGAWSEPLLEKGFNCTPSYCNDPGFVPNARRYPPESQSTPFLFAQAFLYQCQEVSFVLQCLVIALHATAMTCDIAAMPREIL